LLSPTPEEPSYGLTWFEWRWTGGLTPGQGFEVRVWREGEAPRGVHDSQQDNAEGNIIALGDDTFGIRVDISDAAGVRGVSGDYLWTVVLVEFSPDYQDLGIQAEPELLHFVADTGDDGDEGYDGPPRSR
jgi:hypothetical protein